MESMPFSQINTTQETKEAPEKKLREVPQTENQESGISADYINALYVTKDFITDLIGAVKPDKNGNFTFDLSEKDEQEAFNKLGEMTLKKLSRDSAERIKSYTELFPEDVYENVVNDKNRDTIDKLDKLREELFTVEDSDLDPITASNIEEKLPKLEYLSGILTEMMALVGKNSSVESN